MRRAKLKDARENEKELIARRVFDKTLRIKENQGEPRRTKENPVCHGELKERRRTEMPTFCFLAKLGETEERFLGGGVTESNLCTKDSVHLYLCTMWFF